MTASPYRTKRVITQFVCVLQVPNQAGCRFLNGMHRLAKSVCIATIEADVVCRVGRALDADGARDDKTDRLGFRLANDLCGLVSSLPSMKRIVGDLMHQSEEFLGRWQTLKNANGATRRRSTGASQAFHEGEFDASLLGGVFKMRKPSTRITRRLGEFGKWVAFGLRHILSRELLAAGSWFARASASRISITALTK
jgi:hypothetical protein